MSIGFNKNKLNVLLCAILIFSFLGESLLFIGHSSLFFGEHVSPIGLSRIEVQDNLTEWNVNNLDTMNYFDDEELEKIEKVIPQEIKSIDDEWGRAIALSAYIRCLSEPSSEIGQMNLWDSPYAMLVLMTEGKGATCDVYSTVYVASAQSIGIPARIIQLIRPGNIYDTHVVAEVWDENNGKWVVMDPTFDTYYLINDIPASAADVNLLFETASYKNKTEWYEHIKPSNKSNLDEYYIFQYLLYEDVMLEYPTKETWENIPPVRAFRNPDYAYFSYDGSYPKMQNFISYLFDIIFPSLFSFSFISLIYLNLRRN